MRSHTRLSALPLPLPLPTQATLPRHSVQEFRRVCTGLLCKSVRSTGPMRQGKQRAHIRSYLRSLDLPTFGKLTCKHIHALELATILSIPPLRRNRASLSRVADIASNFQANLRQAYMPPLPGNIRAYICPGELTSIRPMQAYTLPCHLLVHN